MQRNFDNKDFEQFLKQNADQYRMYPSEKVWKEIHNSLHSRRRWTGLAVSLLLITGAIVTWMMVLNPGTDKLNTVQTETSSSPVITKTTSSAPPAIPVLNNVNIDKSIAHNKIPTIIIETPDERETTVLSNRNNTEIAVVKAPTLATEPFNENESLITSADNTESIFSRINVPFSVLASEDNLQNNKLFLVPDPQVRKTQIALLTTMNKSQALSNTQKNRPNKKLALQLYFTPGISYRRLTENKEAILAASGSPAIPTNLALQDVKNVVKHKPDLGFELGLAANYSLSKRISLKTGLQFNVNKYDIRAFSYSGEPATIAIQGDPTQQTVTRTSYYRNSNGYKPNWLTNVYFSLSMPVGAELKILNGKKLDMGLGITAQPTYLLDNRAYMISTDYKNYVKVPDLIRRWNVNAGAELFVGIKSGKTRWQIGPQVRYQTLSSFKDKYPVKENLFNFGFKAGVRINQ